MTVQVLTDGFKTASIMAVGTSSDTIKIPEILKQRLLGQGDYDDITGEGGTNCTIVSITYDVAGGSGGFAKIEWGDGTPIAYLGGSGQIVAQNVGTPSIPNPNKSDTINITNTAEAYTIIIELRKSALDFDIGQYSDQIYYNTGPKGNRTKYGVTPNLS